MALASLFLVVAVSGCAGKAEPTVIEPVVSSIAPVTSAPIDPDKDLKGETDAKRHFHHYWGDRETVDIFYMDLPLEKDPFEGNEFGCRTIGHREFDLETDGDDATNEQGSPPVNPSPISGPNPKADVVFAGTDRIDVTLVNQALTLDDSPAKPSLFFRYKPANLQLYQPDASSAFGTCGIPLVEGQVFSINVGSQASDPPHQWAVSRWKFYIIAAYQEAEGSPELPTLGEGTFTLQMTAHNGGENSLDAAHPDLWAGSLTYDLGCIESTVERQLVVNGLPVAQLNQDPREPLSDIAPVYGRIVPLLTQKVVVTVEADYTGNGPETALLLEYFGADTNKYASPENAPTVSGSTSTYEIVKDMDKKTDPPYLDKSLWRFRLVPIGPADGNASGAEVAEFTGTYKLCAIAHRDPTAILT